MQRDEKEDREIHDEEPARRYFLFVLIALAFAGCSSSITSTPKVAGTPTLQGAFEVHRVLSDGPIQAHPPTFAIVVPHPFVVGHDGPPAYQLLISVYL